MVEQLVFGFSQRVLALQREYFLECPDNSKHQILMLKLLRVHLPKWLEDYLQQLVGQQYQVRLLTKFYHCNNKIIKVLCCGTYTEVEEYWLNAVLRSLKANTTLAYVDGEEILPVVVEEKQNP